MIMTVLPHRQVVKLEDIKANGSSASSSLKPDLQEVKPAATTQKPVSEVFQYATKVGVLNSGTSEVLNPSSGLTEVVKYTGGGQGCFQRDAGRGGRAVRLELGQGAAQHCH